MKNTSILKHIEAENVTFRQIEIFESLLTIFVDNVEQRLSC